MDIVIRLCNNIDNADIRLEAGRLNVKFGPNGIGKSTLAKAIAFSSEESPSKLEQLRQFKSRSSPTPENGPSVVGAECIKTVSIFGEEYVSQFVFQRDEIVKNSFEIFVKNADYDKKMADIESLVHDIKRAFSENAELDRVIADLHELAESFGKSQSGISKASRISKGLGTGNKIEHVPDQLEAYAGYIQSAESVSWIKWQIDGKRFLDLSTACPFCTAPTEERKSAILAVGETYDAKSVEHLLAVQSVFARLNEYFSADAKMKLSEILKTQVGLKKEQTNYLLGIKAETETLRTKLLDTKNVSFFSLRDAGKVKETVASLRIDLSFLPSLASDATTKIVSEVNDCLDSVIIKAGELEGEVNKQKSSIEKTIKRYKKEVNQFLRFAGYRYEVTIEPEGTVYKMKLRHADSSGFVESGALHLSYGEKNAFAIVLFMYECLTKQPDLIVLDDPVSSFDDNKKFAIFEMLFRGKDSLQGRTVLMLTHDIEPVIDLIKTMGHTFQPTPVATFLTSDCGKLAEIAISKSDVQSFTQICNENVLRIEAPVIQIIYLRRYFEVDDDKGDAYHLISSLLHRRCTPTKVEAEGQRQMTSEEIANATKRIWSKLPHFDYANILAALNDTESMTALYQCTKNRYTKLQLFRVLCSDGKMGSIDDVVQKFINEALHVENEFIMQLNPSKYDSIPEYIIVECDRLMRLNA